MGVGPATLLKQPPLKGPVMVPAAARQDPPKQNGAGNPTRYNPITGPPVSLINGATPVGLSDSAQLLQLFDILVKAHVKLLKTVRDKIKEFEKAGKKIEADALKVRAKRILMKITALKAKIARLRAVLSGSLTNLYKNDIGPLMTKANLIVDLAASLANPKTDVNQVAARIEALAVEIDKGVAKIGEHLKKIGHANLSALFGKDWAKYIKTGALVDGKITLDELTPKGKEHFEKLGLTKMFEVGINRERLNVLVKTQRRFALLCGSDLSRPELPPKVKAAFTKILALVLEGKLTKSKLNDILKEKGIDLEFNSTSFKELIKSDNVRQFITRVKDFCSSVEYDSGVEVRVDRDYWKRMGPKRRGEVGKRLMDTIHEYAECDNFYDVNIGRHKGFVIGALKLMGYKGDNPLKKLLDDYPRRFEEIRSNKGLTDQQKWSKIVLNILRDFQNRIKAKEGRNAYEKDADRAKQFEKLMKAVQKKDADPAVVKAFTTHYALLLEGKVPQSGIDVDKILEGKEIAYAPTPAAKAKKPEASPIGGIK